MNPLNFWWVQLMPPRCSILGALIGAGASLLGGVLANQGNKQEASNQRDFQEVSSAKQMAFNEAEASKARNFNRREAVTNRGFVGNEARLARGFNKKEATRARAFTQKMSNSAIQRQVRDLKRAGLNPVLAAKYGGSSTPSGSAASGPAASSAAASGPAATSSVQAGAKANISDVISPAVSAFQSFRQNTAQVEQIKAQTELTKAQAVKTGRETRNLDDTQQLTRMQTIRTKRDAMKIIEETFNAKSTNAKIIVETQSARIRLKLLKAEINITEQQFKQMLSKFPGLKTEGEIDHTLYGKVVRYIMRLNPFAPSVRSVIPRHI